MSILKKRIWFVTNGTAKFFYSAPNVRDAETRGREYAVTTGWTKAQLWECTNKEICRNEDLPLAEKKKLTGKHTMARSMTGRLSRPNLQNIPLTTTGPDYEVHD